ncbi:hypothetical protein [Raineyella sp. W15-4]|uniref:hypothetical protein n=1 Tax=Raineyella sp. W15-4 TaxID=3081651 RepID=UPI0029553403|nr:hypothetical protein [Raineyella sp. W15-4]WOQ17301.1 hypothetical protein R0145_00905 [Raineyella sp. W15-4]
MQLDDTQYLHDVIGPLAKGLRSDEDLDFIYLLRDSMSGREIVETVRAVEAIWSRKGTGRGRSATKVAALQRSVPLRVEKVAGTLGVAGGRSAHYAEEFWVKYHASAAAAHRAAAEALTTTLTLQFGGIGALTRDRLDAMVAAFPQYQSLPERVLTEAVAKAGLSLVDVAVLPAGAPEVSAPKDLLQQLEEAKAPSIYHAVFPTLATFQVLGEFRGVTADGREVALSTQAIEQRGREVKRGDVNDRTLTALDHLLGQLVTSGRQGKDLDRVFFTAFIRALEGKVGAGQVAMLDQLMGLGLDRIEGARIVLSLDAEAGPRRGADEVESALASGELRSARRVLAALPSSTPGLDDLETRVKEAESAVDSAVAEARRALAAGDLAKAAAAFTTAATLAADDEQLTAEIAALPPGAPTRLTAAAEYGRGAAQVVLTWSPGPLTPSDATYAIVSRRDRVPLHPGDGDVVESGSTSAEVATGASGITLHVAVFAKGGGAWSQGAAISVDIAPPVAGFALQGRDGAVRGTWVHPSAARSVRVCRDDVDVRLEGPGAFVEKDLDPGTRIIYTIRAYYRMPDGRTVSSPVVSAAIQPLKDVAPLAALDVRADPDRGGGYVLVEWVSPDRAPVTIVRTRDEPSMRIGALVPEERLTTSGERLVGTVRQVSRDRYALTAKLPTGHWFLSAFSLGPSGYVAGARAETMVIPGIEQVDVQRAGSEVRLTWDWPEGVHNAQIEWRAAGGAGTTTIDRHTMRADGGWRVRSGPGPMDVVISAIHDQAGRRWLSAPYRDHIPGAAATCAYSVRHAILGNKVSVTFRHDSGGGIRGDVEVVVRPGQVMPVGPEGATVLGTVSLDLSPGAETSCDFTIPHHLRKPLWVCAFLGPGAGFTLRPLTTKGMKK